MIDKFLFFLSVEPFASTLVPLASSSLVTRISDCARLELVRMLGETWVYCMIDVSSERLTYSKKELKLHLDSELPNEVSHYIAYVADLFDGDVGKRKAIDSSFRLQIDKVLRLDLAVPTDAAFSAVQKLHERDVFSCDIDPVPWIKKTLSAYSGPWACKLQDHELFDGVDDMLPMWMWDVFGEFSWLAFLGVAKAACNNEELLAIVENIEKPSVISPVADHDIATHVVPGLRYQG